MQGFVQAISYTDGDFVKKGTSLFTIEPEPYKLKVEAARPPVASAQATLKQTQAEYERQADLVTQASLDPGQLRQGAGAARSPPRPTCNRRKPTSNRPRSISVTPT